MCWDSSGFLWVLLGFQWDFNGFQWISWVVIATPVDFSRMLTSDARIASHSVMILMDHVGFMRVPQFRPYLRHSGSKYGWLRRDTVVNGGIRSYTSVYTAVYVRKR